MIKKRNKSLRHGVILVTGGAGFIGSHLVDALMKKDAQVCVLDNLSNGWLENISQWFGHPKFEFIRGDLINQDDVTRAVEDCEVVFHLAANPEVRLSSIGPSVHFEQNVVATYNLLEAARKSGIKELVFTSSSTVYGDASRIPTPEDYAPLKPISVYGASKLASEALVSAYSNNYGFRAVVYRLANIVGPRSRHGVIYDFIQKLRTSPSELEILGDGAQAKSYLHVNDCVNGVLLGLEETESQFDIFNLGSEDWVDVKTIADIVAQEMDLQNATFRFTGGVDGGRGWKGDVKYMLLDVGKLKSLGWKIESNSAQAVREATRSVLKEIS